MSGEQQPEGPLVPHTVSDRDPWRHEHGEGERGESVPTQPVHRFEPSAHLIGEPVPVTDGRRRSRLAALVLVAIVVSAIAAVVVTDVV